MKCAGVVLAIDPGNAYSAFVVYDGAKVLAHHKDENNSLRYRLAPLVQDFNIEYAAIEMIACYGMAVGAEVFETCVWVGRFTEILIGNKIAVSRIFRREVKIHLCNSVRAKDGNVRQAIMDKFGASKEAAIGRKSAPGPLYGIAGDEWAALGVAITWHERGTS